MTKRWVEHGLKMALGELKPHPKNSREHSKDQIEEIVAAMAEWDWTNPILVDDDHVILAGHARQLAGIAKYGPAFMAPVSVAHGWTDKQKRRYIIADNRLVERGTWNQNLLQAELKALSGGGLQLQALGFTQLEVSTLLEPPAVGKGSRIAGPVIQHNIVFDNEGQKKVWQEFAVRLRAQYPEHLTFGAKLTEFLKEQLGNS